MVKRDPVVSEMEERLWLAAIGKHPGWNDHLDDIGLDMDLLVAVKRHLYVEGIGGVIGAGTWESMGETEKDEGFAHSFLWRQPGGLVVGRMWSSSDGKGRRKFPMIVCALCRSLPLAFVAGPVLDRLRRLEEECKAITSAAGVISAVDRMRAELRDLASYTPSVTGEPFQGEPAAARLAAAEEMGPDGLGLLRVFYQMEREMAAYLRPEGAVTGSRSRTLEVRAQHMRLPRVLEAEGACWSVWARLLLGRVDQLAPLLLISKDGRPWVDVIVGEPGVAQLVCLQGSLESFPLTTDIPFTIDEDTERAGRALIEQARAGEVVETDPGFFDASSDRLAPFMKKTRRVHGRNGESNRKQLALATAAAAVVLLAVVVLAVVFFGRGNGDGGGGGGADRAESSSSESAEPPPAAPGGVANTPHGQAEPAIGLAGDDGGSVLGRFRSWCRLAEQWYLPFAESLDREAVASDPGLSATLLELLRDADASGLELDPLDVAPGRYLTISALAENPPAEMDGLSFEPEIDAALAHIGAVRSAIGPGGWPAHAALAASIEALRDLGVPVPGEFAAISEDLASDLGGSVARGVGALLEYRLDVERLGESLALRYGFISRLVEAGAAEQADWYAAMSVATDPADTDFSRWLSSTAELAESVAQFGEQLADAARDDLPRVDPGLLGEAMAGFTGASPEEDLRRWLAVLEDKSLHLLDPAADPRRVFDNTPDLSGVRQRLSALLGEQDDGRAAKLSESASSWIKDKLTLDSLGWNESARDEVEELTANLLERRRRLLDQLDALERERRFEAESYLADIRGLGTVSRTGSAAIDGVWATARDAMIGLFENDGDLVALSRGIDGLKSSLSTIEVGMPRVDVDASLFGSASARVAALLDDHRETRLGEAAENYDDTERVARSISAYSTWAEGVESAAALARDLTAACDRWTRLGEKVGPQTFADMLGQWGQTWVGEFVGLDEIDYRLGILSAVVAPGKREDLVGLILDTSTPAEVVYAAWSGLGQSSARWPADLDELASDVVVIGRLRASLGGLPADRRREIEASLALGSADHWVRLASLSGDWSAFLELLPFAEAMGLSDEMLPAAFGFDLFTARLMARIKSGETLDRDNMLSDVERWLEPGSGLDEYPDAGRWLESMRKALSERESDDVNYHTIGPARAGWVVEPFDSGRRLVYTWLDGNEPVVELAFGLIESPETGAFYLAETETPVSLLLGFALAGPDADLVLGTLEPDWAPLEEPRSGPRVWTWRRNRGGDGRGVQLSRSWTARAQGLESTYYEAGLREQVGRPTLESPIQRVSPETAAVLSALAGCRLPTVEEWSAAYAAIGSPVPSDDWNLRDQSFDRQRVYTAGLVAPRWPDEGAFVPEGFAVSAGADAGSHDWSDGRLWFDQVDSGRGRPFRHLIGNVAEYVLNGLEETALLTDRHGELRELASAVVGVGKHGGAYSIIGGSALSAPELDVSAALPVGDPTRSAGYSDVGFRLAFSPGSEPPLIVEISELVRAAPFLRPSR